MNPGWKKSDADGSWHYVENGLLKGKNTYLIKMVNELNNIITCEGVQ